MNLFFTLWFSLQYALAFTPDPALFGSPALLVDYGDYSSRTENFNRDGSETRVFRDLAEILYDWDNNRPWGNAYFPEANKRLKDFRAVVCPALPPVAACFRPTIMLSQSDVQLVQKSLLDPSVLEVLSRRWSLSLSPWALPLRADAFSLLVGSSESWAPRSAAFWNLSPASVSWKGVGATLLHDKDNYRAGFEGKDAPALLSNNGAGMMLNDWLLRHRVMSFAQAWKHAIGSSQRWNPSNPVVDAVPRLFLRLRDSKLSDLRLATELLKAKVSGDHLLRFEKESAAGDFPEEAYQQVAYDELRELLQVQGTYLAAAQSQRLKTSARQKALESLLTIQRYHRSPRFFVMEVLTLMEPITSHAYALDAVVDAGITQALVFDQLKALLGSEPYDGKALFPALGSGLLDPELFRASYLDDYAPDVKEQLAGRDFASLDANEQIRILKLYLQPQPGKFRPMALYRMGALFLGTASDEELRKLAEVVHEARKGNFQ